ncbi:PepSY-like domain-containing protein [Chryseobacterium oryctis]|uniref:PepSY-like domain-containing protein n=1 Tax=Chryseobacterium oryctis TaxID=2952618 RepID=A0ABT3HMH6_9FLAO|nr:PepSY-like domain-containing protein [Chryseobacterium oryctis]MCW3160964.1 PepSY-like domain-containing protein [Chryseobacterium oryctis]
MKNFEKIPTVFTVLFLFVTGFVFAQDKAISYNQLPQSAKTFLGSNFKGAKPSYIIEDREIYGIDEYKVQLSNGMKVEFDSKGNWKKVDGHNQKIPYVFIPTSIKNYSTKSFPNTFIKKIEKKRWSYEIELSNGIDLEFDRKGNFTKIDD